MANRILEDSIPVDFDCSTSGFFKEVDEAKKDWFHWLTGILWILLEFISKYLHKVFVRECYSFPSLSGCHQLSGMIVHSSFLLGVSKDQ